MEELKPIEEDTIIDDMQEEKALVTTDLINNDIVGGAIVDLKGRIIDRTIDKFNNDKVIDRHAESLTDIANEGLRVEEEKERLKVQEENAKNKAKKQEIKNRLIELKTEAIKLKREKKQVLKEQKAEHKKRNDDMLWEKYKGKLSKMNYTYVPNKVILGMLLFFDGIVSFFKGIENLSSAIVKAVKWLIIIVGIVAVLFIFPTTREWITKLLGYR